MTQVGSRLRRIGAAFVLAVLVLWNGGAADLQAASETTDDRPEMLMFSVAPTVHAVFLDERRDQRYVIFGKGFGHGVGMSQWGTYGRALAGQDAPTILASYYPGAMLAPYTISQPIERVRLLHDYQPTADVSIDVITGPVTLTNVHEPVPSGGSFRLRLTPSGYEIIVFGPQGSHIGTEALASPRTLTGSKDTRLRVSFKRAPEVPGVPGASYNVYRGSITLLPGFGGIDVINDVPLDQYLYGTVPAESPYTWPSEALKAQAIAARTYALSTQQSGLQAWDIDDGTIAQMYLGALIEQATTNAAVDSTKGLALLYEGAPIRAYYHACDAGHTEDASLVFPGVSAPYLKGISDIDPSGVPYDHACPKEQWSTLPMNRATVDRILGRDVFERVGSIRWIDVTARSASGRVTQIALGGTAGSYTLTGAEFRSLVNRGLAAGNQLLSTNFDVRPAS